MDYIISCALGDFNICHKDYIKMNKQQLLNALSHYDILTDQLIMSKNILMNLKQKKKVRWYDESHKK